MFNDKYFKMYKRRYSKFRRKEFEDKMSENTNYSLKKENDKLRRYNNLLKKDFLQLRSTHKNENRCFNTKLSRMYNKVFKMEDEISKLQKELELSTKNLSYYKEKFKTNEVECPLCTYDIIDEEPFTCPNEKCGKQFHKCCFNKVRDGKCPYCRIQIKEEKEEDFIPEIELVFGNITLHP